MNERQSRLLTWATGGTAPPYRLELHLTNRCNLRCLSCWTWSEAKPEKVSLPRDLVIDVIEQALNLSIRDFWLVGGGEPMFDPELCLEVQTRIKQAGAAGFLVTNGTLFTPQIIEQLVGMAWDMVIVSLDGPSEQINDRLRNRAGVFTHVLNALREFTNLKNEQKVQLPILRINTVISKDNIDELEGMFEVAAEVGVREVLFHGMNILSPQGEQLKPTAEQIARLTSRIDALLAVARNLGIETNIEKYRSKELIEATSEMDQLLVAPESQGVLSAPCFDPWERMVVLPDGRAGSCNAFQERGLISRKGRILQAEVCDNIHQATLREIWYGKKLQHVRAAMQRNILLPICVRCCVGNVLENQRLRRELVAALTTKGE